VPASRLVNRNVIAGRGRTSMRLEPEFWSALAEICQRERVRIGTLIRRIETEAGDEAQVGEGGRTSAVRVFVLQYFRANGPTAQPAPPAAFAEREPRHGHEAIAWAAAEAGE
jgi:predicted DNA-binding ribbon-helix-helix protein